MQSDHAWEEYVKFAWRIVQSLTQFPAFCLLTDKKRRFLPAGTDFTRESTRNLNIIKRLRVFVKAQRYLRDGMHGFFGKN